MLASKCRCTRSNSYYGIYPVAQFIHAALSCLLDERNLRWQYLLLVGTDCYEIVKCSARYFFLLTPTYFCELTTDELLIQCPITSKRSLSISCDSGQNW